jgi:outer membrane protein assembly factor BamB
MGFNTFLRNGHQLNKLSYSNGTVYTLTCNPFNNEDKKIFAIDSLNGKEKWHISLKTGLSKHPFFYQDKDAFYYNTRDFIFAVDNQTGQNKWYWHLPSIDGPTDETYDLLTAPLFTKDSMIYTASPILRGVGMAIPKGNLVALDINTGQVKWSQDIISSNLIALYNGKIITGEHGIHVYDADSGREEWQFNTGGHVGMLLRSDGIIYTVSNVSTVHAIDFSTQQEKWHFNLDGNSVKNIVTNNDTFFYSREDSFLHALNKSSGQEIWRFKLDGIPNQSSLIVNNDVLYYLSTKYLYAIQLP